MNTLFDIFSFIDGASRNEDKLSGSRYAKKTENVCTK